MKLIETRIDEWSDRHPILSAIGSALISGLMIVGLLIWGH